MGKNEMWPLHYENLPMQCLEICKAVKNDNFQ